MNSLAKLLFAIMGLCAGSIATAELTQDDWQLLEGLRQRRLYSLATTFCQQRLSDAALSTTARTEIIIQWMRLLAESGWHLGAEERQSVWDEAHAVGAEFLETYPNNPRRYLVEFQEALLWLTEGEVLRHEADIDRRGGHSFEVPLERLREAVRRFEKLERDIKDVSLSSQIREGSPESLTEDELHSLGIHLRLQLARVYRNRAECYSPDSDDRVDAATQALRVLGDMLAQTASDNAMSWEGRIEQLVCYRLLESADEAERLLQVFRKLQLPKSLKGRIHAEAARAALVFVSPEEALRWVKLSLVPSDPGAADLDLARLEAFTKSWQMVTPDDQTLQSSWRQRTLSLAKYIAQSHGRYWARRADQLLLRQVQGTAQAGDVEILRRQADDLYLQDKWEASVNMYDQAAAAAEQGGFTDELFLCRYRAGLVQVKRREDHDAMMRLQQVSRAFVDHAEAATAHFAAIQAAIRLARQDPAALDRYEQLLSEHVRYWPDSDGASRAYLWLARLRGHRGDWLGAIALYQHIVPTSRESLPAISGLEASWRERLKELQSQQETNQHDIMPELDNAVRSLQALAAKSGVSSEGVAAPPASKKLAVLAASRLLLEFAPSRAGEAEWMLTQVLSGTAEDDAHAWQEDAQAWLFLARALQPEKREAADQLLCELDDSPPERLWQLLNQLASAATTGSDRMKSQMAQYQLDLIRRLNQRSDLEPTLAAQLPRFHAASLVAIGDIESALALYRQIAESHPSDRELQVEYARLLSQSKAPALREESLRRWRMIADRTPAHSDAWYAAKYTIAKLLFEQDKKKDAAKLIRYLQLTSPLQSSDWSPVFERLLASFKE